MVRRVRAYVTGASGFVGHWLTAHLAAAGDEIIRVDREIDVTDPDVIAASVTESAPDVLYHLAGLAHVGRSWSAPAATFRVNALGSLNVLEAAARCDPAPTVILVSSAEVYGQVHGAEPLSESAELRPLSPYAASKVAAEFVGIQECLGRGVPVVRVRPFNHAGPGQSADFVVSGLARRIVEAELAGGGAVRVGNLQAVRDFTDVRDVVRAYRLLAQRGEPGEVYNVSGGRVITIAEVASLLCQLARVDVHLVTDPALVRPVEVPVLVGDSSRLAAATGWSPQIPFEQTLADVLGDWRRTLVAPT
jgi:GDP-4-dehydro-6-deoxy-D-mannose reductase